VVALRRSDAGLRRALEASAAQLEGVVAPEQASRRDERAGGGREGSPGPAAVPFSDEVEAEAEAEEGAAPHRSLGPSSQRTAEAWAEVWGAEHSPSHSEEGEGGAPRLASGSAAIAAVRASRRSSEPS